MPCNGILSFSLFQCSQPVCFEGMRSLWDNSIKSRDLASAQMGSLREVVGVGVVGYQHSPSSQRKKVLSWEWVSEYVSVCVYAWLYGYENTKLNSHFNSLLLCPQGTRSSLPCIEMPRCLDASLPLSLFVPCYTPTPTNPRPPFRPSCVVHCTLSLPITACLDHLVDIKSH